MLIKRTRILGCLFVSTILVNVILQDIFYSVNIGALRVAILYQVFIVLILWFNKEKLTLIFKIITSSNKTNVYKKEFFFYIILSIVLFIII